MSAPLSFCRVPLTKRQIEALVAARDRGNVPHCAHVGGSLRSMLDRLRNLGYLTPHRTLTKAGRAYLEELGR
jgi:hypothetical protein